MSEVQIEMTWRCSACGNQNRGRDMACARCGDPKDDREQYEMPGDVTAAPAVTDPEMLRLATAGENWRCRYCGSDQRAVSGGCLRCGAGRADARAAAPPGAAPSAAARAPSGPSAGAWALGALGVLAVLGIAGVATCRAASGPRLAYRDEARLAADRASPEPRTRTWEVTVSGVSWKHVVQVEKLGPQPGEGFAEDKPKDAFDVRSLGQRVHHHERVPDGFTTEPYTERVQDGYDTQQWTERVQDGTTSESYTARESCGQDCTTTPRTCKRVCTSNKNGFATCRDDCTGGGQTCTTRYCTVTKTRQVPRYRDVTRTKQVPRFKDVARTRQVPRFKDEPRYAEWLGWKTTAWAVDRTKELSGEDLSPRWPDEARLATPTERARKTATYRVTLAGAGQRAFAWAPADEADLARFQPGSRWRLRVTDGRPERIEPAAP